MMAQKPFEVKALYYMSVITDLLQQFGETGMLDKRLPYFTTAILACMLVLARAKKFCVLNSITESHRAI